MTKLMPTNTYPSNTTINHSFSSLLSTLEPASSYVFLFQDKKIEIKIIKSRRKSIGIEIFPDLKIIVRAPVYHAEPAIRQYVLTKMGWIYKHLESFASRPPKAIEKVQEGTSHKIFGLYYTLHLQPEGNPELYLAESHLIMTGTQRIKNLEHFILQWKKNRLLNTLDRLIEKWREPMKACDLIGHVLVRQMKSRWGSCTLRGKMTFNAELVKFDQLIIEYIVVHEMCHLFEMNHGARFYALLTKYLPDWQIRRKALKSYTLRT